MNHAEPITISAQASDGLDCAMCDEIGSIENGFTETIKSPLNNPVLPSEFDLLAPRSLLKCKWEFASRNPVPFAKAWKGFQSSHAVGEL